MTLTSDAQPPVRFRAYPLFVLALSLLALGLLVVNVLVPLAPEDAALLDYADTIVCVFFFLDFIVQLARARNRWRYFVTWGWLDLVSSIPLIDVFRLGRVVRIIRIVRVLRGLRAARVLTALIVEQRAQSGVLTAGLLAVVLILASSLGILHVEAGNGGNIQTAQDALWWSVTTITTVGYGDRYPITPEGRLIAVVLMFAGIGLFGVLSGFLAAWFSAPKTPPDSAADPELVEVRRELAEIRRLLAERSAGGGVR